jgi:hypothetical protein
VIAWPLQSLTGFLGESKLNEFNPHRYILVGLTS